MAAKETRLVVIIPAHNEAETLSACLESFARQSRQPDQLVVVDDHSSDRTGAIAQAFAETHPWAEVTRNTSSPEHQPGAKVVRSFRHGMQQIKEPFDFIGKFDADIVLPPDYFENVLKAFAEEPELGMCAGQLYIPSASGWVYEAIASRDHIRGPVKCYRASCFEAIGGLRPFMGWDTADVILARFYGFRTRTLPELRVHHLRPTGGAYSKSHARRQGEAFYQLRYDLLLALLASAKMAWQRRNPLLILHHLSGFLKAMFRGGERLLSRKEGRFARQWRWRGVRSRLS
ncbi:glycosyltransferase family A protein [Robiginitalea sp. M366]|uniref:glycosyltransferase n=1 Tax=Robiginitalea aestuariiviva TaxID=3036903 RepID=UPI00240D9DF0|nr:glycosyltransferase family A protein [Robiginitalea aestuariiviva]MDG1572064.1 glycosyltransferase family A protein [Robiginitalea aestuariiviva]